MNVKTAEGFLLCSAFGHELLRWELLIIDHARSFLLNSFKRAPFSRGVFDASTCLEQTSIWNRIKRDQIDPLNFITVRFFVLETFWTKFCNRNISNHYGKWMYFNYIWDLSVLCKFSLIWSWFLWYSIVFAIFFSKVKVPTFYFQSVILFAILFIFDVTFV